MEVFGVVYLIQNQINGKRYVGKTTQTLEQRMTGHLYGNLCVDKAIDKYEIENFRYGVIKTCATEAELNACEKHFIAVLKTKAPYGYNLTDGGEGTSGWHRTPESCAKISAALTGKKKSPEHCAKISAALTGKKKLPETCAKLSAASATHTGEKNPFYGKSHTKESKSKMRAAKIGKHPIDKTRAKMSATHTGKKKSLKHRANISAAKRTYSPYKNLIAELDARQMTYAALAKFLDLSASPVCAKMRGKIPFTERDKVKLVEIFGKPIAYLLERDENTNCENVPAPKRNSPYQNLIAELFARQMTYTALAELLGLSYSPGCARIRGEVPFNDSDKAKLVEIFGKPIAYLLARDE